MMRRKVFYLTVLLSVMTACGRAGTPDPADSPKNQKEAATKSGTLSGGTLQKASPEVDAGADTPEKSSLELPQPYAGYLEALKQFKAESHTWGAEYYSDESCHFENNCFAIVDVDGDGRQELLFNFNESIMAGMRETVYAYAEDTDTLREELVAWVNTAYYSNGMVKSEASHNHGKDPECRGVWPYEVYEYNSDEDCYQLRYRVDSWDGQIFEKDFPDELDLDGDQLLYCITEEAAGVIGNEDVTVLDGEEYNAWAAERMPEWRRIDVIYHPMEDDFADKIKHAYAQAAAYAAQAATWFMEEDVLGDWYYLLYDLDGDGSLELVTSILQGTGRYSDNHFYRLTDGWEATELELVRLYDGVEENWSTDFDLYGTQLLAWQDSGGVIYYEGNDYTRDGTYSVYTEDGFYYLKNGVVYQDAIRQKEHFFSREDDQEDEIHYYNYNMRSDTAWSPEEITEEQYEAIREEYVKNMTERSVYQNWIYFQRDETTEENISEDAICMKLFESALGSR